MRQPSNIPALPAIARDNVVIGDVFQGVKNNVLYAAGLSGTAARIDNGQTFHAGFFFRLTTQKRPFTSLSYSGRRRASIISSILARMHSAIAG